MDHQAYEQACETLSRVDNRIPPEVIQKAVKLLFSTYLLPDYDLTQAQIHELTSTNMLALVLPLPDSGHFQMPPPFRKRQTHTYALFHGTSLRTSQLILLEGKIRPANWSYHKNLQRCDMPTFGAFFLGREVSNSDKTIPEWVARELLDTIQKKGKGQQEVIIGAMYRGAFAHTAYKAGGNEMAQLGVADKGIVTTSEKHTIAHSNHVGLKFVALKWQNLIDKIDLGASSSEDLNYLSTEDRYSGRRRQENLSVGHWSLCIISSFRFHPETGGDISRETWTSFGSRKVRLPQSALICIDRSQVYMSQVTSGIEHYQPHCTAGVMFNFAVSFSWLHL